MKSSVFTCIFIERAQVQFIEKIETEKRNETANTLTATTSPPATETKEEQKKCTDKFQSVARFANISVCRARERNMSIRMVVVSS